MAITVQILSRRAGTRSKFQNLGTFTLPVEHLPEERELLHWTDRLVSMSPGSSYLHREPRAYLVVRTRLGILQPSKLYVEEFPFRGAPIEMTKLEPSDQLA